MTRLPRLKGKEVVRALERAGFVAVRIRGSHIFMKHEDGQGNNSAGCTPERPSVQASCAPSFVILKCLSKNF
jgi:hypothetical protein